MTARGPSGAISSRRRLKSKNMTRQDYIEFILDHYNNPHHKGKLDDPTIMVNGGNPGCGDIVTIYVNLDENDRITDAMFDGQGCTISMAASSLVMDKIIGKTIAEVDAMDYSDLL